MKNNRKYIILFLVILVSGIVMNSTESYSSQMEEILTCIVDIEKEYEDYGTSKAELLKNMDVAPISIGKNIVAELVSIKAPNFCGGSGGNCSMWVIEKNGGKYKILLGTIGQKLNLEKTSTNGYRDLSCPSHAGRDSKGRPEQVLTIFKYNGSEYKSTECWKVIDGVKKGKTKCDF